MDPPPHRRADTRLAIFQMNLALHAVRTFADASRVKVAEALYGPAFSRDGARLFCPGAASETIHTYHFA